MYKMKLFYKLVIMIFIYNLSSISARSAEVPPSLVTDLSKKVISINKIVGKQNN